MEMQTEDKSFSCVHCNLSFEMTKDLKAHMLQHDGKKAHKCNQCGYSSISAVKGTVHQKNFYRSNLIFWIEMRSGIADLGQRGL